MERLSVFHTRIPAIIPPRCKVSPHGSRFVPITPSTKTIKSLNLPSQCCTDKSIRQAGSVGESRFSKFLMSGQYKRNSTRACAEVPSTGYDPVLAEDESTDPDSILAEVSHFIRTSYNFLRPVSILQVIISTTCLFARVLAENPKLFKLSLLLKAFPGLIAMIFANAYYSGINQIYDVDIDRINKPYLPIAAGDLSLKQAWFLMIFYVLAGLSILWLMNADLITTALYCFGLLLATFYSVPPFRFKASSVATSLVLPLNAGITQSVGVLYATRASFGLPFLWSAPIVFIVTFLALFYVVISIVKDILDVEGDMKHNIQTFAAILGPRNTIFLGTGILLMNYVGAIAVALYMPQAFNRYVMLPAHSIFALWLLFEARMVEKANYSKVASAKFYKTVWTLLASEFLLFPFI